MRLRAITEELAPAQDETQRRAALASVTSSSMIDSNEADKTWPFIYSGTLGMKIKQGGYHYDWLNIGPDDVRKVLANVYFGGELDRYKRRIGNSSLPGVAGRIGADVTVGGHKFDSVIAFYSSSDPGSTKEWLAKHTSSLGWTACSTGITRVKGCVSGLTSGVVPTNDGSTSESPP